MPSFCWQMKWSIAAKKATDTIRKRYWAYMFDKTGMTKEQLLPILKDCYLYGNVHDGGIVYIAPKDRHPVTCEPLDTE